MQGLHTINLKDGFLHMSISEKYPENIPWDINIDQSQSKSIRWMLSKTDIVYTFTRSRIDDNYVYIQKRFNF